METKTVFTSDDSVTSMFSIFWNEFVYPMINQVYEEVDPDFKKACSFRFSHTDISEYRDALHQIYREKREWLKEIYMPHAKSPVLDIHKLGAVLCRSIIGYKPFAFDFNAAKKYVINKYENTPQKQNTDWYFANIYANYKVAFYSSIGVAYMNIPYRCKKNNDSYSLSKFEGVTHLNFYQPDGSHECFENSCMIALQKNDVLGRSFDYLGYAIMLYQLEQFNYPHENNGVNGLPPSD